MIFREATLSDIPQIQKVRNAVKENRLSDPALVTDEDCTEFLIRRGKGWVCESNDEIMGFAIADLKAHNIWALFVRPEAESKGVARQLHRLMMNWYFSQTQHTAWLGTAPGTRAADFYQRCGWRQTGMHGNELKFEMTFEAWQKAQ